MKFDLSQIPTGSTIVAAMLDLFADTTSTSSYPGQPMYGNTNASNLMEITASWDKNTVTWNNQPATTSTNEVFLGQTRGDINYRDINISSFVQDWVNNPAQNNGMMIAMVTANYYNAMIFCSSDYPDSTLWPNLSVCYIEGGLNGNQPDTLCGFVFNDINGDGVYDTGDSAAAHAPVLVDGVIYYTDATGYYHIAVSAGNHNIGVVPPFGWSQTSPVQPLNYSVTTTSGQSVCGYDFGIMQGTTGIRKISSEGSLSIFPNPLSGSEFKVQLPDEFETANATLTITDMIGRLVSNIRLAETSKYISVNTSAGMTSGVYLVTIKNDAKQYCGKISIIR
jgi:hypothetical protein